jgi:hypothetical protein
LVTFLPVINSDWVYQLRSIFLMASKYHWALWGRFLFLTYGYFTERRTRTTQLRGSAAISHTHQFRETRLFAFISRTFTSKNFYGCAKRRDGRFSFQKCRRLSDSQPPLTKVVVGKTAHNSQKILFFSTSSTLSLPTIKYVSITVVLGHCSLCFSQSIMVIECREFRDLLLLLRESLRDTDIPHRTKIRTAIVEAWAAWFSVLKKRLAVSSQALFNNNMFQRAAGRISFTADVWTDHNRRAYLGMTAHWLARNLESNNLSLECALIAFHHLSGTHDGKTLAKTAFHLLERAGIIHKVRVPAPRPQYYCDLM